MIKSKTKIETQLKRKTSVPLIQTIIEAKKNSAWNEVASILTTPGRKFGGVNVSNIENINGDIIVIPGKVLSGGEITKKVKIAAINFSEKAKEKLLKAGCELVTIMEEIKNNKNAKGVVILKK